MIEQNYNLNTIPSASPVPIVHVSQYDKGSRTLKFKLFEGSGEYSMASVNGAKINGKKPDGNEFSYNMTIAGNVVSVDVTEQMTAVAGRVVSEIVLTGANSSVLGTANFIIEVEESPMDEGVISDTDIPVIVDFVTGGTAGQFFRRTATGGKWVDYIPSGASWGTITGNLADQTDLNNKFSEINNNISQKANTSDVNSALALKANTADVNTALATKADTSAVNTLAGSLAMIETSPATASHAVGSYIVWNGQLYEVTSAISSGETLVVGTNISARTVGDELTALNNGLTQQWTEILASTAISTGTNTTIPNIENYKELYIRMTVANRATAITIPVPDIISYGYSDEHQYFISFIATASIVSGKISYAVYAQVAFASATTFRVIETNSNGYTGSKYFTIYAR